MYGFSQRSLNNLKGLHPDLVKVLKESIKDSPVDFTIVEGVRTVEQQQAHYAKGRTIPGVIVTNCDGVKKKSEHQPKADGYGYAVDLYPYVDGKVRVNDVKNLKIIADHIRTVASKLNMTVEWGGDWKSIKDYPHFSLKK